jgi:predicted nucleic acid-binding protein
MRLIDSCGWLEYFTDGPLAPVYAPLLEKQREQIIVPSIVVYEVYRFLRRNTDEESALQGVAQLEGCMVAPLDDSLAMEAAEASLTHGLAMADAIVYATAMRHDARVITSDADMKDLPSVQFIAKV